MHKSVNKTIWYKDAKIIGSKSSLQDLLDLALIAKPNASDRLMGDATTERIGINLTVNRDGFLFGQFICFEPGMQQALVTLDASKHAFDLNLISAQQTEDGKQQEFLESIGYFGILGNHVLLVQTKVLSSREFEEYLVWFLQKHSMVMGAIPIVLADPAATVAKKNKAMHNIRGVTIGTPVETISQGAEGYKKASGKFMLDGRGFEALKSFFGGSAFEKLNLKSAIEEDNIEVLLTVRMNRVRVASDSGQDFLEAVGVAARHMNPNDFELELNGGGSLKGSDLRLFKAQSIKTNIDGGLVDEFDMYSKMYSWFKQQVEAGLIN